MPHTHKGFVQAIALVLGGLLGRALIDKVLAIQGGAVAVAEWAQLSSVAEVVSGASLTGIGPAVTVLVAGGTNQDRLEWLKPALVASTVLSLSVAVVGLPFLLAAGTSLVPGSRWLLVAASSAGLLVIGPSILVAHLLGTGNLMLATGVVMAGFLPPLGLLLWAPLHPLPADLLAGQMLFGGVIAVGLIAALRKRSALSGDALMALLHFMPASLAIGILSPAAMVWARAEIADSLAWHAAGQVQAIWRASDWVTAIAAGLLNAYVLPKLGAARNRREFLAGLQTAVRWIVLPAGVMLALLWLSLPHVVAALYRADLEVPRQDAALFLFGDWIRVVSWVALYGLFARRATMAIAVGEVLSLPLFAMLLTFMKPANLPDVGLLWLTTYAVYALFNGFMLFRQVTAMWPAQYRLG